VDLTKTSLEKFKRIVRDQLSNCLKHHIPSITIRMTLPREEGERLIIDIQNLHNN